MGILAVWRRPEGQRRTTEEIVESWDWGRERTKETTRPPPREYPIIEKDSVGESQGRGEERRA